MQIRDFGYGLWMGGLEGRCDDKKVCGKTNGQVGRWCGRWEGGRPGCTPSPFLKSQGQVSGSGVKVRCQVRGQGQVSGSGVRVKCQCQVSGSGIRVRYQGQVSGSGVRVRCQGQVRRSSIRTAEQLHSWKMEAAVWHILSSSFLNYDPKEFIWWSRELTKKLLHICKRLVELFHIQERNHPQCEMKPTMIKVQTWCSPLTCSF